MKREEMSVKREEMAVKREEMPVKRGPVVVLVIALACLAAVLVACGSDEKKKDDQQAADRKQVGAKCPRDGTKDASYSGRFEGPVSMDQSKHVVRVTRDGRPVSGAQVCLNTAMVGMSTMKYTAKGDELAPGRYGVGFKFEMEGTYRGNVVTKQGGKEISIPVSVKVPSDDKESGDMKSDDMKHDDMKSDHMKSDDMKHDDMKP